MQRGSAISVAGGRTMIGAAIVRCLEAEGLTPIAAEDEPDYRNRAAVEAFLSRRPAWNVWCTWPSSHLRISGSQDLRIESLKSFLTS
jgi:hypothetical protein